MLQDAFIIRPLGDTTISGLDFPKESFILISGGGRKMKTSYFLRPLFFGDLGMRLGLNVPLNTGG